MQLISSKAGNPQYSEVTILYRFPGNCSDLIPQKISASGPFYFTLAFSKLPQIRNIILQVLVLKKRNTLL